MDKDKFDVSYSSYNVHNNATTYWYKVLNELVGYSPEGIILNVFSWLCHNFS